MTNIVMQPTKAVLDAAELLDETIRQLIEAVHSCPPSGTFEADVEAWNLVRLIIRHAEGVLALARTDLVLLPSAMVLARAAFETHARVLWICDPDNPYDREARWLAHLQSEEDYHEKMAVHAAKFNGGTESKVLAEQIRKFRLDVMDRLPTNVERVNKMPSIFQILESLGARREYRKYVLGCQFAHGTHHAAGMYRKHLGTEKVLGEFISLDLWGLCLHMIWQSLRDSGERLVARLRGKPTALLSTDFSNRVERALIELAATT